ncbi:uncharacterized protein LOC108201246 [Daucus carota subsp. sativus]|uniref:uncharacterized protein LOC108201246 n=1 Tax=Daucus carota subsp. sativus TaxID=79200 RepID=UPI0007F02E72|nr:PREDICTED: uncharacterized protein LOC108201246 [Daucus carota subsp. sativus]
MSGRLAAWTIELSQFNLEFNPRHSVKSQALSDFVAECTFSTDLGIIKEPSSSDKSWTLFTDGSSTASVGGSGIILTSPEGFKVQQAVILGFSVTNNEAEYEALIAGLKLASHLEVKVIEIFSDSQLVVKQLNGEFKTLNDRMVSYVKICSQLLSHFASWSLNCIDRSANHWADALSKLATSSVAPIAEPVYIRELIQPSTTITDVHVIEEVTDWRTPIMQFIQGGSTEADKNELKKLANKEKDYCIMEGRLYRRALTEPLLKCVGTEEAQVVMKEVHSGICGEHLAGKNMALKILRHGVYWPTIRKDCEEFAKHCHPCQLYGPMNHRASVSFTPSVSPCPFFMWGMDIVGPLPKALGQKQFIIVAVDYHTKWVEAKALARIRETEVIHFFMEFIVFRFGVSRIVVTDNGSQFTGKDFESTLSQLEVKHTKSSLAYPQANG